VVKIIKVITSIPVLYFTTEKKLWKIRIKKITKINIKLFNNLLKLQQIGAMIVIENLTLNIFRWRHRVCST